jgi:hypothetical protein
VRRAAGLAVALLLATLPAAAGDDPKGGKKAGGDERETIATRFVDLLAAGDFATAVKSFDATMAGALPPDRLAEVWKTLNAQAGPYAGRAGIRSAEEAGHRVVFVTCRFEKTALDAKIVFDDERKIAGLFFVPPAPAAALSGPPGYARPGAWRESAVTVGEGDGALPGLLTRPARSAAAPGVVLVHGSGPLDRDETVGPNKPFRDLALGLASRGIAVLRYDKRTFAHPAAIAALGDRVTLNEETVEDAVAALARLRAIPGVDPDRVFVLGHSLGGIALPRVAARDARVAGFIMMAAPSRPLDEVYRSQVAYLAALDGTVTAAEREGLDAIDLRIARLRDPAALAAAAPGDLPLGLGRAYWSDLKALDARASAARLRGRPILVVQGGRDYQSTPEDLAGWKRALAGHPDAVFRLYPGLNHLFMEGSGPGSPDEYAAPGHVAAVVVEDLAAWIAGAAPLRPRSGSHRPA